MISSSRKELSAMSPKMNTTCSSYEIVLARYKRVYNGFLKYIISKYVNLVVIFHKRLLTLTDRLLNLSLQWQDLCCLL